MANRRFKILTAVAAAALFSVVRGQAQCPNHWFPFQESCYIFVDSVSSWPAAQSVCNTVLNAHLIEIESADENDFLLNQLKTRHLNKTWTGLNDFVMEGEFVWASTLEVADYTNWAPGEPNDDHNNHQWGDQDCGVIMQPDGKWDDEYCESAFHFPFFCEVSSRGHIIG